MSKFYKNILNRKVHITTGEEILGTTEITSRHACGRIFDYANSSFYTDGQVYNDESDGAYREYEINSKEMTPDIICHSDFIIRNASFILIKYWGEEYGDRYEARISADKLSKKEYMQLEAAMIYLNN